MTKLSARSEAYLRRYRGWLRMFPNAFRSRFADEMALVLRDQLEDLEERGHAELTRDAYHAALSDIPLNLLQEWLTTPPALSNLGLTGTRAFWYALTFLSLLTVAGAIFQLPAIVAVASITAVISVIGFVWYQTGRVSLTILCLGIMIGGIAAVMSLTAYFPALTPTADEAIWSLVIGYFGAIVPATFYAAWLRLNSAYYSPKLLASLGDEQLRKLEQDNARKRRFAYRGILVTALIILIPNLIALYDPARDLSFISTPEHSVPRQQNAYYKMEAIPLSASEELPTQESENVIEYIEGIRWNPTDTTRILSEAQPTLQALSDANQLAGYQMPGLEFASDNPSQPMPPHAFVDYPRYQRAENLALLSAKKDFLSDNDEAGLKTVEEILQINAKIDASNQPLAYHSFIDAYQLEAAKLLLTVAKDEPASWKAELKQQLPAAKTIWKNGSRALAWDTLDELGSINQGSITNALPLPPYAFQPNRTKYLVAEEAKKLIDQPMTACADMPGSGKPPSGYDMPTLSKYLTYNGFGNEIVASAFFETQYHGNDCNLIGYLGDLGKAIE